MGEQVGQNFAAFISSMSHFCTAQYIKEQDCNHEKKIMLSLYFSVLNFTLVFE